MQNSIKTVLHIASSNLMHREWQLNKGIWHCLLATIELTKYYISGNVHGIVHYSGTTDILGIKLDVTSAAEISQPPPPHKKKSTKWNCLVHSELQMKTGLFPQLHFLHISDTLDHNWGVIVSAGIPKILHGGKSTYLQKSRKNKVNAVSWWGQAGKY
jgi:hypothetical protein